MNSGRKVLVNCCVIALQDSRLLYPCCKLCLCRSAEESDSRSRCIKCGFTCDIQNVDYRYRLSLKVSRGRNILRVTVFGGCLNPFFGVTAGDLQRFVDSEQAEGPHSLHQLLIKSVEDCFIGKSFVFGFKLSGLEAESCLLNEQNPSLGFGAESAQLVACQILSPNGAFLGMTVFAYLQSILQASRSASSQETDCQSLQKDSLLNSSEYTLPLCVSSQSEASGVGLTQLWQTASDMVLCFSPEEASGHSLERTTTDDASCITSQNEDAPGLNSEPEWPAKELSFLSESQTDQIISTPGVLCAEDTLKSIRPCERQDESRCGKDTGRSSCIDMPAALISNPGTNTVSCGYQPERSVSDHCSLQELPATECNKSAFKKSNLSNSRQNMTLALEDAPLSESLGSFVSLQTHISHISVAVDQDVLKPADKCKTLERNKTTPKKANCPLMPLDFNSVTREYKYKERSLKKRMRQKRKLLPLSKPNLPATPKVSHISKDSGLDSYDIKDTVSNSPTKIPVNTVSWLQHDQGENSAQDNTESKTITQTGHATCPEMQSQSKNNQESSSCGYKDEYNCSADLFCQSNLHITSPDLTDRAVSDPKTIKKDCLSDINTSEREISTSLHFAPSLQSTPIAYPHDHHSYRQLKTLNCKFSDSPCSRKQMTPNNTHVLGSHSSIIQESQARKPECDQTYSSDVNSDSGCASEVRRVVEQSAESEDVFSTNSNEWSRDLFANSF
uniref:Replication factor A C-terminal domain-containing protein n=1 Tax=Astyanax mexicanus TaxID=7994 RepID=A0A8B9KH54_ASTMX